MDECMKRMDGWMGWMNDIHPFDLFVTGMDRVFRFPSPVGVVTQTGMDAVVMIRPRLLPDSFRCGNSDH